MLQAAVHSQRFQLIRILMHNCLLFSFAIFSLEQTLAPAERITADAPCYDSDERTGCEREEEGEREKKKGWGGNMHQNDRRTLFSISARPFTRARWWWWCVLGSTGRIHLPIRQKYTLYRVNLWPRRLHKFSSISFFFFHSVFVLLSFPSVYLLQFRTKRNNFNFY